MNIDQDQTPVRTDSPAEQKQLWPQPFSGYQIMSCLSGDMEYGSFFARDNRLERDVVIKTLKANPVQHEGSNERFFNEARQIAHIKHANIARGLDVGRSGEILYFVSEYLRGESLQAKLERLQNSRLREFDTLKIIESVSKALDVILAHGLVHRDLKPANIFLTNSGLVKLTDLGIAKDIAYADEFQRCQTHPEYISPEQAASELNIDIRSDLYALGAIWFRLLVGRPPFTGDSPDIILKKHINDTPESVTAIDPRITPATAQLISWLLSKDREKRPKTPQQFLTKLLTHPLIRLQQEKQAENERTESE